MAEPREKRSSQAGAIGAIADQVGGRLAQSSPTAGGGGYQGSRTASTSRLGPGRDPRLAELVRMGIARAWLRVAEAIGVDAFHTMWQILDEEFPEENSGQGLRIWLRSYKSYHRFQRNRFIETLFASGKSVAEVQAAVRQELSEQLHKRTIARKRPRRENNGGD